MKVTFERVDLVRRRLAQSKSDFAAALGVDRKTLQRIQSEECEVSDELFSSILRLSGYPEGFFFQSAPELPNPYGISFRSLRSLTARPREAALAAAALAFELDDWIRDRIELPKHDLPQMAGMHPREAAIALRSRWSMGSKPIANMINVLESHGVRVFSLVEETRHLDAYAFWRNDAPYVFLNTSKTGEHSRFDAAHELAHLVLHRHSGTSKRDAETEANTFASEFLIPQDDLVAALPRVRAFKDIVKAKHRWGVSVAALIYALRSAEVITEWQQRSYYIELNRNGRENEPEPCAHETSQIWAKVLKALWAKGLTISRIAENIHIPEHEITKLLFNIAGPARAFEGRREGPLQVVQLPKYA